MKMSVLPLSLFRWEAFPFRSALQGPIQLQLALSVRGVFESLAPEYFVCTVLHHFSRRTTFGKMVSRRTRTYFLEIWKLRYMDFGIFNFSEIMEFDLKWVHMARCELILQQGGTIWLRIIFRPFKGLYKTQTIKKVLKSAPNQPRQWADLAFAIVWKHFSQI